MRKGRKGGKSGTDGRNDEGKRKRGLREMRARRIDGRRDLKAYSKVFEETNELNELPILCIRVLWKFAEGRKDLIDLKYRLSSIRHHRCGLVDEALKMKVWRYKE